MTTSHHDRITKVVHALGGISVQPAGKDAVTFLAGSVTGEAHLSPDGSRLYGSIVLDLDVDAKQARAWIRHRVPPRTGRLGVKRFGKPTGNVLFLAFERSSDVDDVSSDDPLLAEARKLRRRWSRRPERVGRIKPAYSPPGDPRSSSPGSTWIVVDDDAPTSSPTEQADADRGIFDESVDVSPRVQPGDLLLFYVPAPVRQVGAVARAVTSGRPDGMVRRTPPVAIEPIGFDVLKAAAGGRLVLRRGSARRLSSDEEALIGAHLAPVPDPV